jgi:hypothetical protein
MGRAESHPVLTRMGVGQITGARRSGSGHGGPEGGTAVRKEARGSGKGHGGPEGGTAVRTGA